MNTKRVLFLIASIGLICFALRADSDTTFALTVKLKGRYNPDLTVCTLVHPGEPFYVEWSNGTRGNSITGTLHEQKGDSYPLILTVKQGITETGVQDSAMQGYKLKLGVQSSSEDVVSSTFDHVEQRQIVLAKGFCPGGAPRGPLANWP